LSKPPQNFIIFGFTVAFEDLRILVAFVGMVMVLLSLV